MTRSLDKRIVDDLYRKHWAHIEWLGRQFLTDPDEVADAVQDVFIKLITKGQNFRSDAEWKTWLYRVTINICLNHRRNKRRRRTLIAQYADALRPRPSSDPAVIRDCSVVLELLGSEDPKTQKVVICHYMSGMSQHEIGEYIGISRISVNKRLAKFKKRARRQLTSSMAA